MRDRREYFLWGFITGVAFLAAMVSLSGCSAFDPKMQPPIRSAYEERDRETGEMIFYGEIHEMRCRNGAIEMRTFNMATHAPDEWRRVDPGHDWNVWVARWAWEGAQ